MPSIKSPLFYVSQHRSLTAILRVDRALRFSPIVQMGLPLLLTRRRLWGGGGHIRLREMGWWVPVPTRGQTRGTLGNMYFVLLLVRRKLPLSHWFSQEIHVTGTKKRAQVRPTCSIFEQQEP